MFSLVQFIEDGIYSSCRTDKIRRNRKGEICAPFGRSHYAAKILLQQNNLDLVRSFAYNLQYDIPTVLVENCIWKAYSYKENLSLGNNNSSLQSEFHEGDEILNLSTSIEANTSSNIIDSDYIPDETINVSLTAETDVSNNLSIPAETSANSSPTEKEFTFLLPSKMEKMRTFATTNPVPTIEEGSKKNYCSFCNKLVTKIVRHLGTVHRGEDMVKQFLSLPKRSAERKKIITEIKNNANFDYNTQHRLYDGHLIVSRRPLQKEHRTEEHYVPCAKCKAFFSKLNLRNHFRKCTEGKLQGSRRSLALGRRVRSSIHEKACDLLRDKIFPIIREDDTILDIRNDELLIIYANDLCTKFASRPHCYSLIRNKIRKIALFLSQMKKVDSTIDNLSDVFHPRHYDKIIQAINIMGKCNKETGQLEAPSTAFDLGTQLKILCETLKCECIKKSDDKRLKEVDNTALLMKQGLTTSINVNVKEAQINTRRKKQIILPTRNDISKLMVHLYTNQEKYYNLVKNKPFERNNWVQLTQFTMLCIQTFNRRRPGETERITIEDFEHRETISETTNPEIYSALSEKEKKMAGRYCRFQLRGKLVKNVAVLLNNEIERSIELILRYRHKAGVPKANPYIFGQPYSARAAFDHRFFRICPLLNKAAVACGAENPYTLRTIQLRKHVATEAALLHTKYGFKTNDLANFMGHHEQIHKNHYRMPDVAKQITGIGRLLEYVQGLDGCPIKTREKRPRCLSDGSNTEDETPNRSDSDSSDYSDLPLTKKRNRRSEDLGKEFIPRRSWTPSEKKEAFRHFKKQIEGRYDPSAREIRHVMAISTELKNRSEAQIKLWVRNQYEKIRRSREMGTGSD